MKVIITNFLNQLFIKIFFLLPIIPVAQNSKLNYNVIFMGNNIGWLRLEKNESGNKSDLLLISEIKAKIIFPITLYSKETSSYDNGKLIYSSQFRKTNGKTKFNKEFRLTKNEYEIIENNNKTKIPHNNIKANLLSLYFQEPRNIKEVFCENGRDFSTITKTNNGAYKVNLPNGNCNSFFYDEGKCVKVIIQHKFYTAEIIIE